MDEQAVAHKQMPRYKCHKEVWALKIAKLETNDRGVATLTPADQGYAPFQVTGDWMTRFRGSAEDPGYYVVYEDGYTSWSPTEAFEKGYTRILT